MFTRVLCFPRGNSNQINCISRFFSNQIKESGKTLLRKVQKPIENSGIQKNQNATFQPANEKFLKGKPTPTPTQTQTRTRTSDPSLQGKNINEIQTQVYDIISRLKSREKKEPEFFTSSLSFLQTLDFNIFKHKPGKLVFVLHNLVREDTVHSPERLKQKRALGGKVSHLCSENFDQLSRADICLYLHLFLKLNLNQPEVFRKCFEYIEKNLSDFPELDLVNSLFCLGQVMRLNPQFFEQDQPYAFIHKWLEGIKPRLAPLFREIIKTSSSEQNLTNLIWCVDFFKLDANILTYELHQRLANSNIRFNDINFSSIVNSLTHMEHTPPKSLYEFFVSEFGKREKTMNPKIFASTLRALFISYTVNLIPLLQRCESYILNHKKEFLNAELAALLIPYSMVITKTKVLNVLFDEAKLRLPTLKLDELCKVFWCFSFCEAEYQDLDLWLKIETRIKIEEILQLREHEISQVATSLLTLILVLEQKKIRGPEIKNLKSRYQILKKRLSSRSRARLEGFTEEKDLLKQTFSLFYGLRDFGFEVTPETIVEIYNIDFVLRGISPKELKAITAEELKNENYKFPTKSTGEFSEELNSPEDKENSILIEMNGRFHYCDEEQQIIKNTTILKADNLKRLGYTLVSLNQLDLYQLSMLKSTRARAASLVELIQQRLP